jgi:hypothetical protein
MDINAAGPLRIYKALAPLLFKSSAPKIIGMFSTWIRAKIMFKAAFEAE